jgi:pimeloyl-ACP methyl ester carboxylesterase
VELRPGDVSDGERVREAMRGSDGVFHVAGWYRIGARQTRAAWATNVAGAPIDSGHFLTEENPDATARALREFFAGL